jgi:hypothetical protein
MWPYRDLLIDALNDDMPFDRFTIEQIAGDMLPDAGISQRIATGFHRNTMLDEETSQRLEQLDAVVFGVSDPGEAAVVVVFALLDHDTCGRQLCQELVDVGDAVVDFHRVPLGRQCGCGRLNREDDRDSPGAIGIVALHELDPKVFFTAAVGARGLKVDPKVLAIPFCQHRRTVGLEKYAADAGDSDGIVSLIG